jgi:hypothetical protein
MGRQILAVSLGMLLGYLGAAAGGYFLYQLSGRWPDSVPALARYVLYPFLSLLVGACVGALAKSRPSTLAILSLVPAQFIPLFFRRQTLTHLLFLVSLAILNFLIGAAASTMVFRLHNRNSPSVPIQA